MCFSPYSLLGQRFRWCPWKLNRHAKGIWVKRGISVKQRPMRLLWWKGSDIELYQRKNSPADKWGSFSYVAGCCFSFQNSRFFFSSITNKHHFFGLFFVKWQTFWMVKLVLVGWNGYNMYGSAFKYQKMPRHSLYILLSCLYATIQIVSNNVQPQIGGIVFFMVVGHTPFTPYTLLGNGFLLVWPLAGTSEQTQPSVPAASAKLHLLMLSLPDIEWNVSLSIHINSILFILN